MQIFGSIAGLSLASLLVAPAPVVTAPVVPAPVALPGDEGRSQESEQAKEKDEPPYDVGKQVDPDLSLHDIDGQTHRLGDHRGRIVVLDFWSIQCPWSKKYEKVLLELHEEYGEREVVFLAVDSNHTEIDPGAEDPYARIREYVEEAEVTYPILIDEGNVVADLFEALTTPHVYILDRKGVVAYNGGVDDDPRGEADEDTVNYVANALDALLAGQEVETAKTKPFGCTIQRVKKDGMQ